MRTQTEFGYDSKIEGDVIHTRLDASLNWFRRIHSGDADGIACCAMN